MDTQDEGLQKIYAKRLSGSHDDLVFRNNSLLELAQLYLEKCDFPNALDCLQKVKTDALQFHLYDNYFQTVAHMMRIFVERLEIESLNQLVREVVQVGEKVPDFEKYLSKINYNRGIVCSYSGKREEAYQCFQLANDQAKNFLNRNESELTAAESADLLRDMYNARASMIIITLDRGEVDQAMDSLAQVRDEIDRLERDVQAAMDSKMHGIEGTLLLIEARCLRKQKKYQKALDCFWQAHRLFKSHKIWNYYYHVLLGLGLTYLDMRDVARANIFFDLIDDAIADLELHSLKRELKKIRSRSKAIDNRLLLDRERKLAIEKDKGEIHFERRFILLEILYLLASDPGKVFTKDQLVRLIWKENYNPMLHDSKVYTSISRLRKLIEPDFKKPVYILNERDGYVFNPNVQVEDLSSGYSDKHFVDIEPITASGAGRESSMGSDRLN